MSEDGRAVATGVTNPSVGSSGPRESRLREASAYWPLLVLLVTTGFFVFHTVAVARVCPDNGVPPPTWLDVPTESAEEPFPAESAAPAEEAPAAPAPQASDSGPGKLRPGAEALKSEQALVASKSSPALTAPASALGDESLKPEPEPPTCDEEQGLSLGSLAVTILLGLVFVWAGPACKEGSGATSLMGVRERCSRVITTIGRVLRRELLLQLPFLVFTFLVAWAVDDPVSE